MHRDWEAEILIVGASFGGVSAALAAARTGRRVVLTEESGWVGGQATAQGVPLDEHPWIERYGSSESYRRRPTGRSTPAPAGCRRCASSPRWGAPFWRSCRRPGCRPDTVDGLAVQPYVRESRRIRAEYTVTERSFHREQSGRQVAPQRFADAVAVGGYCIDVHEPHRRGSELQRVATRSADQPISRSRQRERGGFLTARRRSSTIC